MPSFLLSAEAVNLGAFIFDTEDLSTRRGGGLMLLYSPRRVQELLVAAGATNPFQVSAGASQCLFSFDTADDTAAKAIRDKVAAGLRAILKEPDKPEEPPRQLGHATFVVDVQPLQTFAAEKEKLLAANRWRQMQQTRFVAPPENNTETPAGEWPYCGVDLVRPATAKGPSRNEDKRRVSATTLARQQYGRDHKWYFYEKEAGLVLSDPLGQPMAIAWDFHEVAGRLPHRYGTDAKGGDSLCRLHDKIAVVYIDGNQFGKQGLAFATTIEKQAQWDRHIQEFRKEFLRALVEEINGTGLKADRWRAQIGNDIVARIETLLWGGDELTLVVPAWKGWDVVRLFYREAKAFYEKFAVTEAPKAATPKAAPAGKQPMRNLMAMPKAAPKPVADDGRLQALKHACGLVFCHAQAPIQGILRQADELAQQAKDQFSNEDGLTYLTLESFDNLGEDWATVRQRHLPRTTPPKELILHAPFLATALDDLTTNLVEVKKWFPRSALYRILKTWREGQTEEMDRWLERACRDNPDARDKDAEDKIPPFFKDKPIHWLHLAELWDYLPEEVQS